MFHSQRYGRAAPKVAPGMTALLIFERNVNVCAVYSEADGKLAFKASYRLKNVNRAASSEELKDPVIDILNGYCIYLAGQKTLVAVEVFFKAED